MVRDPEGLFEQVSRAVADGDAIDWSILGVAADDPQARAVMQELRVLAEVARLHRDTLPDAGGCAPLPPAPLQPGDYWGHLTLRGVLGRGARGHVYRAWDPQLDREVALKLTVDRDEDRRGKDVISEARLLAKVKHPNVATVFGAERRSGLIGVWMELIEGDTLETVLARSGRFNAREAALIGLDVCAALSAVHAAGLLHRDVKAQNVMRDRNGRVVLMDFGTGRDAVPSAGAFVHDEVGTPLYMAPELFEGGKASVQSDIYSVGVLLYRLVTGSVPVDANSPTSLKEVHRTGARKPLADVRSDLPLAFIRVVERALSSTPYERHPSAGALEMALAGVLAPVEPRAAPAVSSWRALAAGIALGALVVGAVLGTSWWISRPVAPQEIRFGVYPAPRDEIESVALSPDGLRLAYTAAGRLQIRRMTDIAGVEVDQTQGARDPFWSPDGQWIAFFKGVSVWKVRAAGGDPQLVAPARRPSSGSWGPGGTLLYSVEHGTTLVTVPASGGSPRVVRVQRPGVRMAMYWPSFVGDGSQFVYSAISGRSGKRALYLAKVADPPDADDRELVEALSNPIVAGDRLFYTSAGQLKVQRLDLAGGRLAGDAAAVVDGVRVNPYAFGAADVSVAVTGRQRGAGTYGIVAFVGTMPSPRSIRLVDGHGRRLADYGEFDTRDIRLSPDDRYVAYEQIDPETSTRDIWVLDLQRHARVRLTQHQAEDMAPMWSPDSRTVYFLSRRDGHDALYAASAQGAQREIELFAFEGRRVVPRELTPDGRSFVYEQHDQQSGWDIWMRTLDGSAPKPVLQSPQNDQDPSISPDGRFLAYSSPESGGRQVWIMPLPADGRRWRVSGDYGREPAWGADGKTLFFHGLNKTLMRVRVDLREGTPVIGTPEGMFQIPFIGYDMRHHFDVLSDQQHFVVNAPQDSAPAVPATVILNAPLP